MENKKKVRKRKSKKILWVSLIFALFAVSSAGGYYFYKYNLLKNSPQVKGQIEAKTVLEEVAQLIELPKDEIPTIATVADPDAVKNQPFFAKAKKGDKVLIFSQANKAILYDPIQKKILEIAPFRLNPPPGETP